MSRTLKRLAVAAALCELGCGGSGHSSPAAAGSSAVAGAGGASSSGGASGSAVGPGGSGGSSAGGASGGTLALGDSLAEGCIAYASAVCLRDAECSGYSGAFCSDVTSDCPDLIASPGATRTAAGLKACAEAYRALPCDQVNLGVLPDCVTPGLRAPGEACIYPSQCSSLRCESPDEMGCGKCALEVGAGASCTAENVVCSYPSQCVNGVCGGSVVPAGPNQPCSGSSSCEADYYCAAAGDPAVCTPLPSVDQPCGNGYLCAAQTYCAQTLTCRPNPGLGEACGVREAFMPSGYSCAAGLICSGADPDRNELGTCVPLPQVGEPCIIPPQARVEGCASGLRCDFRASPPVCAAPSKAGSACLASYECEAGLGCSCALHGCEQATCAKLRYRGETCDPADLASHCHPAFDCKDGTCTPGETRGVFAKACGL